MDRSRVIRPSLCFAALGGGLVLSLALTGGPLAAQGVRPPKPAGPALLAAPTPPAAQGTVSALTGTSFTLTSPAGITDTVDFTSTTAVRSGPGPVGQAGGATATLADGDQVQVFGSTHGNTIAASAILLAPSPPTPPAGPPAPAGATRP